MNCTPTKVQADSRAAQADRVADYLEQCPHSTHAPAKYRA